MAAPNRLREHVDGRLRGHDDKLLCARAKLIRNPMFAFTCNGKGEFSALWLLRAGRNSRPCATLAALFNVMAA